MHTDTLHRVTQSVTRFVEESPFLNVVPEEQRESLAELIRLKLQHHPFLGAMFPIQYVAEEETLIHLGHYNTHIARKVITTTTLTPQPVDSLEKRLGFMPHIRITSSDITSVTPKNRNIERMVNTALERLYDNIVYHMMKCVVAGCEADLACIERCASVADQLQTHHFHASSREEVVVVHPRIYQSIREWTNFQQFSESDILDHGVYGLINDNIKVVVDTRIPKDAALILHTKKGQEHNHFLLNRAVDVIVTPNGPDMTIDMHMSLKTQMAFTTHHLNYITSAPASQRE